MKNWRMAMWGLMALALLAPAIARADVVDSVVKQLQAQGYSRIEVSRTWLGRAKIEARRNGQEREIVVNRNTGEILRDYWEREDEEGSRGGLFDPDGATSGGNRGPGGSDDDDDDDRDDDDEDDSDDGDDGDDDGDGDGDDGDDGGDDDDDD